ncbi:2-alkenal reductase (NADP(+)-dependent) isoform X2 [Ricinus communis]|uniref:2-alkenal reductase (NADP(+)-dependent) isoform X2 n=1 Tax=Ricinus communis TaxID=3988 RepID=UPI0007727CE3|nr:2-alkenal reductase (NADP(+)-dependent) isoform X2 [Ricinus communis]|eukprot:XP_015581172.1 2-alkenal reductase (NADP(+)-dependent) isoform X2 [Ricinus communis]
MSGDSVESKEWYMAAYAPQGVPTSDHLKIRTATLSLVADSIPDDHVAVEILWISVDPYQRTRMTGFRDGLDMPPFDLNQVISTLAIGRVIRSKSSKYKEGDNVFSFFFPAGEFCVTPSDVIMRKIDKVPGNITLPHYLSCFAWVGIKVIGDPRPGSNVFISAAAGGVGMVAGQLAKLKGCRVIGSAGTDEKIKLLKEEFGYDDAFNYHTEKDFDAALSKYFPDGIDLYLDNVGGKMLEGVLNHVNHHARIPLCGMISQYNKGSTERDGIRNLFNMIGKEVRMEGFMVGTYLNRFPEFMKEIEGYIAQGKLHFKHKIFNGIESFLDGFGSMFSSSNTGKVIIKVK